MTMKYSDIFANRGFINQMQTIQEVVGMVNSPAVQVALNIVNNPVVQQEYQSASLLRNMATPVLSMADRYSAWSTFSNNCLSGLLSDSVFKQYQLTAKLIDKNMQFKRIREYGHLISSIQRLDGVLSNYNLMHCYPDDMSDEEVTENEEVNNKIVTEIFSPEEESDRNIHKKDSAIITLSPINDTVLKYLSENPQALYQLTSRNFEIVMAEIYSKLGYKVELTKATRDGGKDLIIRKPGILGDFIYYVECKKYSVKNPVGVGIVRDLVGVINMDKVNAGVIATTSYFAKDARDLILDNNLSFQIKLHDYDKIKELLYQVV